MHVLKVFNINWDVSGPQNGQDVHGVLALLSTVSAKRTPEKLGCTT